MTSFFHPSQELVLEFTSGELVKVPFKETPFEKKVVNDFLLDNSFEAFTEKESILIGQLNHQIIIKINHFMSEEVVTTFYEYIDKYLENMDIVFDVRGNLGGNSGFANEIAQAFFEEPLETERSYRQIIDGEKLASSTMILYNKEGTSMDKEELAAYQQLNHQFLVSQIEINEHPKYQGVLKEAKVTILQDKLTYSSAENFIINFDNKNRATLIGENTAGSTGQPAWIKLKTGGMFMVTAKKVRYPNGKKHHNIGVEPSIHLPEINKLSIETILNTKKQP